MKLADASGQIAKSADHNLSLAFRMLAAVSRSHYIWAYLLVVFGFVQKET